MKTPEEIKKGLAEAPHIQYRTSPWNDSDGHSTRYAVAIGYGFRDEIVGWLQQLESELEAVKRERDAALYDMHQLQGAICAYCKNLCRPDGADHTECREFGDLSKFVYGYDGSPLLCGKFAWRGVCPENTEVQDG